MKRCWSVQLVVDGEFVLLYLYQSRQVLECEMESLERSTVNSKNLLICRYRIGADVLAHRQTR